MSDLDGSNPSRSNSPLSRLLNDRATSHLLHANRTTGPPSSISSFSASDNDLIMSTRPNIDEYSQGIPEMRPTAKRRQFYNPPEPEEHIPSSVIRDSFKSFDDSDQSESMEIETARGLPPNKRNTPSKLNHSYMASDAVLDIANSSPFASTRYAPQTKTRSRKNLGAEQGDLRKHAQLRRASQKTVAPTNTHHVPVQDANTDTSFALPDVTGLSNIMKPVVENRLPQRSSRRSYGGPHAEHAHLQYMNIEAIPIPEQEKIQMVAWQAVQQRIEDLEAENALLKDNAMIYEEEIDQLEEELRVHNTVRQADSALGTDEDRQGKQSQVKLQVENTRLESQVRRLERRVKELEEAADHSQELTKRLKNERRQLFKSLHGSKDSTTLHLQTENGQLRKENKHLRERVDELEAVIEEMQGQLENTRDRHDDETQNWTKKLAAGETAAFAENKTLHLELESLRSRYSQDVQQLREEAERRKAAARAARAEFVKLQQEHETLRTEAQKAKEKHDEEQRKILAQAAGKPGSQAVVNEELRQHNEDLRAEIAKLKSDVHIVAREIRTTQTKTTRSRSKSASRRQPDHAAKPPRVAPSPDVEDDDSASDANSTTDLSHVFQKADTGRLSKSGVIPRRTSDNVEADTYLSVLDTAAIDRIRKTIEAEHYARRGHAVSTEASNAAPTRKSSLKPSVRTRMSTGVLQEDNVSVRSFRSQQRDAISELDVPGAQSRSSSGLRRRASGVLHEEGMTSAFIVPDITLNAAATHRPTLSRSARGVLSSLAPHSPTQCTVCHRIVSAQNPSAVPASPKITVALPVSSRNEEISALLDTTYRPSEPPLRALSRVIRALADEIVHLKLDLHDAERALAAHDPATSKQERLHLHVAIAELNAAIKIKCDQIYSLYDALEAHRDEIEQEQSQQTEKEGVTALREDVQVELEKDVTGDVRAILKELKAGRRVTIQTPPVLGSSSGIFGADATVESMEEEDGDDDELPWEGFTDTGSIASSKRLR